MRFEPVDHPPLLVPGPWPETLRRWNAEGLPQGADLYEYFGLDRPAIRAIGIETMVYPPCEEVVLSSSDEFVIKINKRGVKVRSFKDHESMPEYLEYPIHGPQSMAWIRRKLDPETPGRIATDWFEEAERMRRDGALLFCNGGSYFAFLNEHMGTEKLAVAYYDAPAFIHQVNEMLCRLCENALNECLPRFRLDYLGYHEDMAYKNGPMISPDAFVEFMTPYYRRVTKIARAHGIDIHWMDSDGDIRRLIPLWLDCGINVFYPLEAAAGMDVVALRAEYGQQIGMIGGFDKRILAAGAEAVTVKLNRIRPVIEAGGYIPNCDHGVPPDVPFESVRCVVATLKSLYGMN